MENKNNKLFEALTKAQLEITAPQKSGTNGGFKNSKYCKLDDIYAVCRIPLASHGLTYSHSVESGELITTLRHVCGEQIVIKMPLFLSQQTSHGFGSALTYARRYSMVSLLGLESEDDDDGNAAVADQLSNKSNIAKKTTYLNADQQEQILNLIGRDANLYKRVLDAHEVKNLCEIESEKFPSMIHKLQEIKKGMEVA